MSFTFKLSKPGKNVLEAEREDLIIDGTKENLKILKQGEETITATGAGDFSKEIEHNLGYVPMCFVYYDFYNSGYIEAPSWYFAGDDEVSIYFKINEEKLILCVHEIGENTYNFKYLIFANKLE